ncbi:hypothetical protein FS749_004441 [Ceratobasidium sp. UAMH 11750]|nr:hypothetical protein FS749_004441 [Ceratobasidium sp. UAMH 11750]
MNSQSNDVSAAPPPDDGDISDSQDGVNRASNTWWRDAYSVNQKSVQTRDRSGLVKASQGRRCLITGEEAPAIAIQMCHLIPKCTRNTEIAHLQYAFGRKLNLNSRWFNLLLRSDIHLSFDGNPPGWALVPLEGDAQSIRQKIQDLRRHRQREKITGAWPDFRSKDWFPTKKSGYEYEFVPLNMAEEHVVIFRRNQEQEGTLPGYDVHHTPYPNFPRLRSHVHPYAVIYNAAPKFLASDSPPSSIITAERVNDILWIYNALTTAFKEEPTGESPAQNGSSHGSPSGTVASNTATRRSECLAPPSPAPNNNSSPSSALPPASPDQPGDFDDLLDNSNYSLGDFVDEPYASSQESLCISTPNDSVLDINTTCSLATPFWVSAAVSKRQELANWIAGVTLARQQEELAEPEDEKSPESNQYAAEPARQPPTENWHNLASEFAPWWVVLPEPQERGVISSNDWAEISNYQPLVRRIDGGIVI